MKGPSPESLCVQKRPGLRREATMPLLSVISRLSSLASRTGADALARAPPVFAEDAPTRDPTRPRCATGEELHTAAHATASTTLAKKPLGINRKLRPSSGSLVRLPHRSRTRARSNNAASSFYQARPFDARPTVKLSWHRLRYARRVEVPS